MATKAVLLAQRNKDGADLLLPNTSADLVGYKHEETRADNVKGALDELMAAKPGIVQRVEALENKIDGIGGTGCIPFDGGSLLTIQATKFQDEFPSVIQPISNGGKNVVAELSDSSMYITITGRMAYHFDSTDIVFDEPGFYSISFQWGHYPAEGSEEHDLSYNIIKKDPEDADYVSVSVESGKIDWVTDTWNYTDVRCILNVKAGTRVQTHAYVPPVSGSGQVDTLKVIRFIGTIFKYPVTNEYQVSNAEYRGMYQTAYVAYLPAASSLYPNENFFDIDWTQGGLVNETPNLLEVVDNTTFSIDGSGLALFNFGLSFSVADNSDSIDLIAECLRLSASGTEVVLKASTMAIRKEQLNGDVFSLTVLAPIAEDERVCLRVRTAGTINVNLGCVASVSCTILPSITDTSKLEPFTPPTASEPGKAGLVPAPLATSENELLNRFLSANGGWGGIDLCALHPSASSAEQNKVLLDMGGVAAEGVNIDTLTRAGIFGASTFTGTLPEGTTPGGVLINVMNMADDGKYYPHQIFITYYPNRLFFRANRGGFAPGETPLWDGWAHLTPIPQAAAGVGQFIQLWNNTSVYTLPAGGVWVYYTIEIVPSSGIVRQSRSGLLAGGTPIVSIEGTIMNGWAWRVA